MKSARSLVPLCACVAGTGTALLYLVIRLCSRLFFKWWRAPRQTLRTHYSQEAYCATLWWRWRWWLFLSFSSNGAPVEWNWQGKIEELGENPAQCHFVHHESHMDWPGIEPGPPRWVFTIYMNTYFNYVKLSDLTSEDKEQRNAFLITWDLLSWWLRKLMIRYFKL
jgi:hypothetical protein